jgi:hypothetical protein
MNNGHNKDTEIQKLLDALRYLDLDLNWVIAVASLSAQEIAVKKKLNELGETYSEEDFQKLCEKLIKTMENQKLEPPNILLSVSRSYRPIRAKIIHSISKSLHPSEVEAILNNTIALIKVFFEKDISKLIAEGLSVGIFINDITKKPVDEQIKTFSSFSIESKRYVFDVLLDKISLMEWGSLEANQNIFVFMTNAIKFESNMNLQTEFCEKLLRKTLYGVSIPAKNKLLLILVEITKLDRIKNLIKEKNFVDLILTEFETSNSFDRASINASIILNLATILNGEQINRVVDAIISNDQITYSWGAQNMLKRFISMHKDRISKEKIDKLHSLWQS